MHRDEIIDLARVEYSQLSSDQTGYSMDRLKSTGYRITAHQFKYTEVKCIEFGLIPVIKLILCPLMQHVKSLYKLNYPQHDTNISENIQGVFF